MDALREIRDDNRVTAPPREKEDVGGNAKDENAEDDAFRRLVQSKFPLGRERSLHVVVIPDLSKAGVYHLLFRVWIKQSRFFVFVDRMSFLRAVLSHCMPDDVDEDAVQGEAESFLQDVVLCLQHKPRADALLREVLRDVVLKTARYEINYMSPHNKWSDAVVTKPMIVDKNSPWRKLADDVETAHDDDAAMTPHKLCGSLVFLVAKRKTTATEVIPAFLTKAANAGADVMVEPTASNVPKHPLATYRQKYHVYYLPDCPSTDFRDVLRIKSVPATDTTQKN